MLWWMQWKPLDCSVCRLLHFGEQTNVDDFPSNLCVWAVDCGGGAGIWRSSSTRNVPRKRQVLRERSRQVQGGGHANQKTAHKPLTREALMSH